jgi:hypothetical protein
MSNIVNKEKRRNKWPVATYATFERLKYWNDLLSSNRLQNAWCAVEHSKDRGDRGHVKAAEDQNA